MPENQQAPQTMRADSVPLGYDLNTGLMTVLGIGGSAALGAIIGNNIGLFAVRTGKVATKTTETKKKGK